MTLQRVSRIALGCVTVFLLTALFLKSRVGDVETHERVLEILQRLRQDELVLSNDIFRVRHGILTHFDSLTESNRRISRSVPALQDALHDLKDTESLEAPLRVYLEGHLNRMSVLEEFKSGMAVLRNSLAHFPTAATAFVRAASASGQAERRATGARLEAILRPLTQYRATSDAKLAATIRERIGALRRDLEADRQAHDPELKVLLRHAELILSGTAAVERTLAELTTGRGVANAEELLEAYQGYFRRLEATAEQYRFALFLLSIVLMAYAFHSVLQLARARRNLIAANETLERRVEERTAALQETNRELESEILERKQAETKIRRMALEDALTGLPNRKEFHRRLEAALAQGQRSGQQVGTLLLDLDNFKLVNDSLGHPAGDALLRTVSKRLRRCLRRSDTVARLGGDEFGVIIANPEDFHGITAAAERILEALSKPFSIEGRTVQTGTSIGITVYPDDDGDCDQLIRNADLALYRSKGAGRGTFRLYDEAMHAEIMARQQLEEDLRDALEHGEFIVQYQPQLDVKRRRIVGAESLIRWDHPEHGIVSPARFIPVAEDSRLIIPISKWLLRTVCLQLKDWHDQGHPELSVSVNLSALHFKQPSLVDDLAAALQESAIPPDRLELEITESMVMERRGSCSKALHRLKDLGVRLAIDDFGTGYSSLSYLKEFPVDRLKIDKSFVREIVTDQNDATISVAMIKLAHSLDLSVIAEGVESRAQQDFLAAHGCDAVQGFHISRPLLASRFIPLVERYADAESEETAEPPERRKLAG